MVQGFTWLQGHPVLIEVSLLGGGAAELRGAMAKRLAVMGLGMGTAVEIFTNNPVCVQNNCASANLDVQF